MQKYSFTIDVTKIPKESIIPRTYTNKSNESIAVKEVEFEAVINKNELVTSGATWELYKVGFITFKGKKLENGEYSKEPIFGDVKEFRTKGDMPTTSSIAPVEGKGIDMSEFTGEVNSDDIPF
jgi:hypothetical protein